MSAFIVLILCVGIGITVGLLAVIGRLVKERDAALAHVELLLKAQQVKGKP